MQAGRLRHRVSLQRLQEARDQNTGAVITDWVELAKLWAEVAPLSAREFVASQAVQSRITARITIRYREDITAKDRIVYRGQVYNIEGVLTDPASGLEYITLPVSTGVNDG